MTTIEPGDEARLEIGHVLFVDIVGYSRLLTNEQREQMLELNRIVRETEQFRAAEAADKLVRLPTGDGMVLAFFTSPDAPVRCAIAISRALKGVTNLPLRMGIHSGPVEVISDVNDRTNLAGAGINIAQRVMDCGDARHILLSKRAADDLAQFGEWQPQLHDLGEIEVKHGLRVGVVSLHNGEIGNPEPPGKVTRGESERRVAAAREVSAKRRRIVLAFGALLLIAMGLLAWQIFGGASRRPLRAEAANAKSENAGGASLPASEKSIAVLPFENLSASQENEFFTVGVQDEILTDLAKVADLKVISRTSTEVYKPGTLRNLREIGQQLGVAHVLEGSVQRSANRVRATAQLIDARTDVHIWAEHYDRDVTDAFAIQTDIAEAIVRELRAKLSPSEDAAIKRPAPNPEAFDLYLQAKQMILTYPETANGKATLLQAVRLLDEAIARDGKFALAYCWATTAHDNLYFFGFDHTPARLAQAKATAQTALALAPDLGEAHLAQALIYYHGTRDYAHALEEVALAKRTLPNSAETYSLAGWIARRQGRWDESRRNLERAAELDPRNPRVLGDLSVLYDLLHDYDAKEALYDRALIANPSTRDYFQLLRAETEIEKGNLAAAHAALERLPPGYDPEGATGATRMYLALNEHQPEAARKALAETKADELIGNVGYRLPRSFYEGLIARASGDQVQARTFFTAARTFVEAKLGGQFDDALAVATLGIIQAGIGEKEKAITLGRRAVELQPITRDAVDGATALTALAQIYAWTGETDAAIEQLTTLSKIPGGPDHGQLLFDPIWDSVRKDPRFQALTD